jgi:uncharacterized LabA/DUF88 family protein
MNQFRGEIDEGSKAPINPAAATSMAKLAVFVDGANMFYAQRKLGWHLDYRKLYDFLTKDYEVYNAFYFTSVPTPVDTSLEGFLRALTAMGYTVRRKALKEIMDQETGETFRKANLDIELVIDMFNTVDLYDVAILCTGDGDFERAVELLRSRGKRVLGVGSREMAAYDLINAVDRYIFLEDLREQIGKPLPDRDAPLPRLPESESMAPRPADAQNELSVLARPADVASAAPRVLPVPRSIPGPLQDVGEGQGRAGSERP